MKRSYAVAVAFGGGGLTSQAIEVVRGIECAECLCIVNAFSRTGVDLHCVRRLENELPAATKFVFVRNPALMSASPITRLHGILAGFLDCRHIYRKYTIENILVVGSYQAIPQFLLGGIHGSNRVFVESLVRVRDLSTVGKIVYYGRLADTFLVRDQALAKKYPRVRFEG